MNLSINSEADYPPPLIQITWRRAYRIVSSRFPTVGPFDRIADPADMEALFELESLTNPRLRDEVGALSLVPKERRVCGPGTTPIMAAFTHLNPCGSRFSDGGYGVFYAAHVFETAVKETMHHKAQFMAATHEPAMKLEMRCYQMSIHGMLHDVCNGFLSALDPHSYGASQALARRLRGAASNGLVYPSVRHIGGTCVAVFYPDLISPCTQVKHLIYNWDGERIGAEYAIAKLQKA